MSFGLLNGWLVAAIAAVTVAAVTVLFFMKVRHPRVLVPSLLLWRRVLDEDRAVTFWERVRKAVSYAVTVLVPLLVVLALGRPERNTSAAPSGPLTIVIDSSLSMLAGRPDGRSRWEAARDRALALASGDADVTLLTTADGIVAGPTSDREALRVAFNDVGPALPGPFPQIEGGAGSQAGGAGLQGGGAALQAGGAALQAGGAGLQASRTIFLTDGVTSYDLPPGVRVESMFAPASNAAITAFDVRRDWRTPGRYEAYVELANFAAEPRQLTVTVDVGSSRVFERTIAMSADEIVRQSLPFHAGDGGVLRAAISSTGGAADAVPQDDEAFAWVRSGRPATVTLVTRRNTPLETLLGFDGSVSVARIEPEQFRGSSRGVLVFDRWAPDKPSSQPSLYIAPPAVSWLALAGRAERPAVWSRADQSHPAVRGVDGRTLRFDEVQPYDLKDWTPLAFTARGTPLVAVREVAGVGQALFAFDLTRGNVANDPAFPVLVGDVLEWFARPAPLRVEQPGSIRMPGDVTTLRRVNGGAVGLRRVGDVNIAYLREPGVYLAERPSGQLAIAINTGSRASSNVRQSSRAGDASGAPPAASAGLWIWLVGAALVLLAIEWYTWQRRVTV